MNKKEERKRRAALSLFYAFVIFLLLLITILLAAGIVFILTRFGYILGETPTTGQILLLMLLVSLIIGLCAVFFGGRLTSKPLQRVTSKMNRLATGHYDVRLQFKKPFGALPLIGDLVDSFNKMAQELENTETLRNDFINNFSHELKTPIVSISGFAKLLKRGNLTEEERSAYIDIIEEESLRLSAMAESMLALSRVENRAILTDLKRYNLSEQLRSCILLLEAKWSDKRQEIEPDFEEYMISANEELLRQVWINLLDNAVKFAPRCGIIRIRVEDLGETLAVTIENTGSEIPPDEQERIFGKFYQIERSHSGEGNGIGLAIVRKVVELHSGSVSVRSGESVTAFTVTLPKEQSA